MTIATTPALAAPIGPQRSAAFGLARGTLRHWWRDRLAVAVLGLIALLTLSGALLQHADARAAAAHRAEHQAEADAAFAAQPDRHPHRMVHYGHYVFRTPAPLAVVDPGVDAYTGRSIFLEGHRRNTPTFARVREASLLARFGALSPAFVLQVLLPLALVLLGAGAVAGERQQGTALVLLAQGTPPSALLLGKALALALIAALALLPMTLVALTQVLSGAEEAGPVLLLVTGYGLYLLAWVVAIVAVSAHFRTRAGALAMLLAAWSLVVVLLPRLAVEATMAGVSVPSRAEVQIATAQALRSVGDAHDAGDPAFERFRQETLARYGVDRVEDLPVNWRGLVAERGEAEGKVVLDRFADARMALEAKQARLLRNLGWLNPLIGIRTLSMTAAGTDLAQHHRFIDAAEAHRFALVQRLNRLQAETITLRDDAARSTDSAAEARTRISAAYWREMPDFAFTVEPAQARVAAGLRHLGPLLLWLLLAGLLYRRGTRRLVDL